MESNKENKNQNQPVTQQQIDAWKAANPRGLWELSIEDKKCFVRKPTRNEMKYAMTLATKNDPLGMVEEILNSCFLGGDREILEDDDYFYGAAMQLQELIEIKNGELKKL